MATEIYLGNPPQYVIDWIKAHSKPAVKNETHIKFVDGTEGDYLIKGAMDCPALIAAGLMPPGSGTEMAATWNKGPMEVEIGSAVTSIGSNVFSGCSGLTSVTIPNSVTSIGNGVFDSCSGLTSVTIPSSVTSIGSNVFYSCSGLTSVTIPEGVTSIGDGMFDSCSGLTSVTIPSSVTSIGNYAFFGCSGLTSVTFSGKDKATVQGMANYKWGIKSGCVIYCTDGDITV